MPVVPRVSESAEEGVAEQHQRYECDGSYFDSGDMVLSSGTHNEKSVETTLECGDLLPPSDEGACELFEKGEANKKSIRREILHRDVKVGEMPVVPRVSVNVEEGIAEEQQRYECGGSYFDSDDMVLSDRTYEEKKAGAESCELAGSVDSGQIDVSGCVAVCGGKKFGPPRPSSGDIKVVIGGVSVNRKRGRLLSPDQRQANVVRKANIAELGKHRDVKHEALKRYNMLRDLGGSLVEMLGIVYMCVVW
jgi:hypothetical protein